MEIVLKKDSNASNLLFYNRIYMTIFVEQVFNHLSNLKV